MFMNFDENDIAFIAYGPISQSANTTGVWNIPQKANFVTFICIGGGGGGGGGRSAANGIARGGGGGGSPGAITSATYHVAFLPESIAYQVGGGGAGGAAGVNGTFGGNTIVNLSRRAGTSFTHVDILAFAQGGTGGTGTQTTGAGAGGTGPLSGLLAGTYPFVNQSYLVDIGSAGIAGGNGGSGTGTPGDSVISFNGNSFTGGGGGGALTTTNVPSAGGAVLNTNHTWLPNIPAATQSPGNVSGDGTFTWKPLGGAGGGGAGAPGGVGNPGGNGGIGCGGGGGSAGTTGGRGGDGGPGLLIILTW